MIEKASNYTMNAYNKSSGSPSSELWHSSSSRKARPYLGAFLYQNFNNHERDSRWTEQKLVWIGLRMELFGHIKFSCDYLKFLTTLWSISVIDKAALPLWWFYVRKFCIIFPTRYILHDCIYICVGIIWHLHIFADKIHFWHSVKTNRQMIVQMTMSKYIRRLLFFQFKTLY